MVEWKRNIAQVITLIVGTGLVASGFNSFYNDFYNKPRIDTQIIPPTQNSNQTVVITNDGRIPATNFLLTLQIPHSWNNYLETFTTLNGTSIIFTNSTILQVGAPMFPHGEGSRVTISLGYDVTNSSTIYPQYTAYVTSEQGSSKIFIGRPISLADSIFNFLNPYWIPIVTIAVGIYILLSIPSLMNLRNLGWTGSRLYYLILPFLRFPFLSRMLKISISYTDEKRPFPLYNSAKQVLDDVIDIKKRLPFLNPYLDYSSAWNSTPEETRLQIFRYDMKVYTLIESLFLTLGEQHRILSVALERGMKTHDFKKLGDNYLKLRERCNEIMNKIDWKDIISPKQ